MSKIFKNISIYILLFIVIAFLFTLFNTGNKLEISFSDFVKELKDGNISEMYVEERLVNAKLNNPKSEQGKDYNEITVAIDSPDLLYEQAGDILREKVDNGDMKLTMVPPQALPLWLSVLPTIIFVIIFILFWFFFIKQSQYGGGGGKMMSFGKSRAKMTENSENKKTFDDVAGEDEEKEELQEIVDFLKNPKKYTELGARIPKGMLLVGPPGTGKTLLAKAVAGEAGVPFFSISGSDFVEMFVGVGASRVRDLFEQAKKQAPCIVFIDEIDAVGRHRGAGLGGGHDEREQTLNQLLVEMDGFGINEGVIILAATNRPDILDPALLRPGRFDRQVVVGVPDVRGREAILKVHSKGKPLADDVDLSVVAKTTAGFTGADLENLMNEGAIFAARKKKKVINKEDLDEAMIKVIAGPEKKTRVMSDKSKKLTAYHEAGHALVSRLLPNQDPVHQISIIPRGRAGGYTLSLPKDDKFYVSKQEMLEEITVLLAGRVAEKLKMDDISSGASNDIERATSIARNMVMKYGMSDKLGPMTFGTGNEEVFIGKDLGRSKDYSEALAAEIDEEVSGIIKSCYDNCIKLLTENDTKLCEIAELLIKQEKIESDEFEALFSEKSETEDAENDNNETDNTEE
ncbi:MAG: ATP-dependent zinc metalloprotease FtsH [Clostridia bacterium]|nr:ATP-dependent zinc metalloprotease FtsH [Clostridia bacterium]